MEYQILNKIIFIVLDFCCEFFSNRTKIFIKAVTAALDAGFRVA